MPNQFSQNDFMVGGNETGRYGYGDLSPEEALAQRSIAQKKQMAQLLMSRGLKATQQPGQMVGRFYVPSSPLQGLAGMAEMAAGMYGVNKLDEQSKESADKFAKMRAEEVQDYIKKTSPQPVELAGPGAPVARFAPDEQATIMNTPNADPRYLGEMASASMEGPRPVSATPQPPSADTQRQAMVQALSGHNPALQRLVMMEQQQKAAEQEKTANREFLGQQRQLDRENALLLGTGKIDQMMTMGLINAATGKQLKEELIASQEKMNAATNASREKVAGIGADAKVDAAGAKAGAKGQMPSAALKMQQEGLDSVGLASSLNADLNALHDQVATGKLDLGLFSNIKGTAKNLLGMSDEQSRNLATFKAMLEKQRNDSLRLNKGVQTEGDAKRAWDELIATINDPKLVMQRLKEIAAINDRAASIHTLNVDTIRKNYGLDPMEMTGYSKQPAAVGAGTEHPKISSDAEFEALPSGATFVGPDGKTRKKP